MHVYGRTRVAVFWERDGPAPELRAQRHTAYSLSTAILLEKHIQTQAEQRLFCLKHYAGTMNEKHGRNESTLFQGGSPYAYMRVTESEGVRVLSFGPKGEEQESACYLADPDISVFEYPRMMLPALMLKPDSKDILLVGLGGGYLPGLLQRHRPDIRLTVVELDPLVVQLAEEYFYFKAGGSVSVHVAEGRSFLEKSTQSYDQIWLDAYDGTYIPPQLASVECVRLCHKLLRHKGVLVQNVHPEHPLYMGQQATLADVFDYFYLFSGQQDASAVLMAQKSCPKPHRVPQTFARGFKQFGPMVGPVNLRAELGKASVLAYKDPWAILHDEAVTCSPERF